jgi:rhodanese-related sulfurtransferase
MMMQRLLSIFPVLFLLIIQQSSAQQVLSIDEFQAKIGEKGVQILDVRTMSEYNSGFIKSALQADWNNRAQFNDRTQHLDKSKPVYVYCASGVRSGAAAAALREKGYTAINMEGGLNAWKKAGKPIEGATNEGKISSADYQKYISDKGLVLVDFGAPWCPPCKKMEPVIAEVKKKSAVTVRYVDGGANADLMNTYKIEAMPTFILYKNGREVWRKQGLVSLEEFEKVFKSNA